MKAMSLPELSEASLGMRSKNGCSFASNDSKKILMRRQINVAGTSLTSDGRVIKSVPYVSLKYYMREHCVLASPGDRQAHGSLHLCLHCHFATHGCCLVLHYCRFPRHHHQKCQLHRRYRSRRHSSDGGAHDESWPPRQFLWYT